MDKSAESYIIDDQDAGLFRVNRRAFTDPECLADERRRVFDKCWIYVGHESEAPHAGDYPLAQRRGPCRSSWCAATIASCACCLIPALIADRWYAARSPATPRPSSAHTMHGRLTLAGSW